MSNNSISTIVEQQTITSMEIAEITGKNHSDVLRAIRKMEPAWEKEKKSKFAFLQRRTQAGKFGGYKMNNYYALNREECLFVATKFNDQARARLVIRWAELEEERFRQTHQQPATQPQPKAEAASGSTLPVDPRNMSRLQILQLALQAEEENERLRAEKEELEAEKLTLMVEQGEHHQQIKQLQQKVSYLNVIMADNTAVTASQIAQDYGMGAPSFNKLLNGIGIQRKVGGQWILYSEHVSHGYVATRMIPIHHTDGPDTYKPMTVWTQLGRKFLYDRLKKHGVLPVIERNQQQAQVPAPATGNGQKGGAVC